MHGPLALLLLAVALPAAAQTTCTVPVGIKPIPADAWSPDGAAIFPPRSHVLALSWSPEFCRTNEHDSADAVQCRLNRFGFVVHGLWPQGERGFDPEACRDVGPLSVATLREHLCMMPGARLMQHEWAQHGSCGWPTAEKYLAATASVWRGLRLPDVDTLPPAGLTAGKIRDAFATANPTLPRRALAVVVGRKAWLREVRVCLDLALAYAACPAGRSGAPDKVVLRVWPRRQ